MNALPASSHQTILAPYLPSTPRNSLDLLHLCWEESNGGCVGVPVSWGFAKMEQEPGGEAEVEGTLVRADSCSQLPCIALTSHLPCSNNPANKAGSTGSILGFLHINGIKATV